MAQVYNYVCQKDKAMSTWTLELTEYIQYALKLMEKVGIEAWTVFNNMKLNRRAQESQSQLM